MAAIWPDGVGEAGLTLPPLRGWGASPGSMEGSREQCELASEEEGEGGGLTQPHGGKGCDPTQPWVGGGGGRHATFGLRSGG